MDKGASGCTSSNRCSACEGDCDSDSDCRPGLKCFQRRQSSDVVPGCATTGYVKTTSDHDYCYSVSHSDLSGTPSLPFRLTKMRSICSLSPSLSLSLSLSSIPLSAWCVSGAPGSCDESVWPDKDHGLICGECKVLVDKFNSIYQTCDGYCASIGKTCVGAWEEVDDTCQVENDMTCDQTSSSSDAICQCSPDNPSGVLLVLV